eukprot:CAMPEP_0176482192 /NCGR_PEP_ID=MMETSP0200_2-20121128/3242_1 /TAXON_ID=947934 /ORGANISM="Chaetoceros sp., Strain GSL56" /LENGTH=907 /DNA_ID=CAMNT_0017878487 /DNA_START=396 /DNA_END=3119 /DNA_ORIENTATION=-
MQEKDTKTTVRTGDLGTTSNRSVQTIGFQLPANSTWGKQRVDDKKDEAPLNNSQPSSCTFYSKDNIVVVAVDDDDRDKEKGFASASTAAGTRVNGASITGVATTNVSAVNLTAATTEDKVNSVTMQTKSPQKIKNGKKVHDNMNQKKNNNTPTLKHSTTGSFGMLANLPKKIHDSDERPSSKSILPRNQLSKPSSIAVTPFNNDLPNDNTNHVHTGNFIHLNNMLPIGTTVKGTQRIKSRKKILSPLKKHILKERLLQWQKSQGLDGNNQQIVARDDLMLDNDGIPVASDAAHVGLDTGVYSSIVFIKNYVFLNELEDDDEYEEIVENLTSLAKGIGTVSSVHVPRFITYEEHNLDATFPLVYVQFKGINDAIAAKACWDGMAFGGNQVSADIIPMSLLMNESYDTLDQGDSWKKCVEVIPYSQLTEKSNTSQSPSHATAKQSATVTLYNILTPDDLDDEDCLEETLQDIRKVASTYGHLAEGDDGIMVDKTQKLIMITYADVEHSTIAAAKLNGSILGGIQIHARIESNIESNPKSVYIVHLENILCDDDYEDEDCLEATKDDIRDLATECGSPLQIDVHVDGEIKGRISISYSMKEHASCAVAKFSGMIIGGKTVRAWMGKSSDDDENSTPILELQNVLSDEDYEDEECLEETKKDLLAMVQQYGEVEKLDVETTGRNRGLVSVLFLDSNAALQACEKLNGAVVGGSQISANIRIPNISFNPITTLEEETGPIVDKEKVAYEPLYSGDKIIPEQYALCKRVPKIPNPGVPREYAKRINDDSIIPLLFNMLGELMRLQIRAKENNNKKAKRRLVLGLREVARGIRANKVKMVIMANNLDHYGALDVKLEEILNAANEHDIPVIFELNKRKLGKALGKTLKISVVGIENADGAYEPFKKLKRLYETT